MHVLDGALQIGRHALLGHECLPTRPEPGRHELIALVQTQKHDLRLRSAPPQLASGLKSVEAWHRDVQDHHVRVETKPLLDGLQSIAHHRHDVAALAQDRRSGLQHFTVVVRQKHAQSRAIAAHSVVFRVSDANECEGSGVDEPLDVDED